MKKRTRIIYLIMTIALIISLGCTSFASADMQPPITITYDLQGGTLESGNLTELVPHGGTYSAMPTVSRAGFTLHGWYTEPDGDGEKVTENTPTTVPADHTLYAKWTGDTYAVNFDLKDGTLISGNEMMYVTYGTAYGTLPEAEKATYIFGGWYTGPNGTGNKITSTTQVTITDTQTLYANWTRPTVKVTYDPRGGTINATSLIWTYTYGENYGLLLGPVYSGYVFNGWYTALNGGEKVDVSTPVLTPNDHTLYARWTPNTYTVTLDLQDINADTATLDCTFNSAYGPLPTPTRHNYTFEGWYTASGNNGTLVTAETTVSTTYDHTLYAKWTAHTYTVTLNPQGGEVTPATQSRQFNSPYGDLPTPTRPYYIFEGWYTASDDSSTLVTAATTVSTPNDHTLYAKWTPGNIAVTLDPQGGAVSRTIHYCNLGEQYRTLPEPTRTGYTFYDWYITAGGSKTYIRATDIVSIPNNHTLYAHWVRNVFTITFDIQGGSFLHGASATKLVSYGAEYGLLPFGEKQYYLFGGWWTEPGGRGTQITSFTQVTLTANQTLYASWTLNFGPSLPYAPPPPPPPMPIIIPNLLEPRAYIIPPPPPPPPLPLAGFTPNIVARNILQDGTQRTIPGNYDPDTGRFNFLYDTLPEDTGDGSITSDYDQTPPSGLSQNHWAYQDASRLLSQGILDDGPIVPGATMTRGDLIQMLHKSVAFPLDPAGSSRFSDTTNDDTAINWAAERGIINGFPDGTARPNAGIIRQEAFVIIARFLEAYKIKFPDANTDSMLEAFSDTSDIDDWARNDISTFVQFGIVRGAPGDNGPAINPLRDVTQEEMIALISRMIGICY